MLLTDAKIGVVKSLKLDLKQLQQFDKLSPLFVFVFALVIRLYNDLVLSQQRLCSFGDGYFFLKTGQELAKAITSASGLSDFLAKLTVHTSEVAGSVATFGSGALADRLLLDGPVYTCFLAIVHILTGVVTTTDYAQNSNIFSVANSLIDAISCVLIYFCGRLAFNSKAGWIAALLFAVYPAAILNTRLCYSELFTYFLLLLWSTLSLSLFRLNQKDAVLVKTVLSFFLGAISILLLLARSVFVPLPLAALAILFIPTVADWKEGKRFKPGTLLPSMSALIVGGALCMAPWLWFTHQVTGKFVPWVNRAPGYNLFVGNQLNTDGWRTWPAQPGIPNETSDALKSLSGNFSSDPCRFSALILRKESRLWAGVWNDFKHACFGFNWQVQNVFHDLLLLLAVIGFTKAIRKTGENTARPAIMFALFSAYHAVYAGFEPVARYAITAMPFIALLAGAALSVTPSPVRSRSFFALITFGALFFALLDTHFSFIPFCFSILPTDNFALVAFIDAALWIAGWVLLGVLSSKQLDSAKRWQSTVVWAMVGLLMVVSAANLIYDPAKTEWVTELKEPNDAVQAEIAVAPVDGRANVSYLIVDLQTDFSAPNVTAKVNGVTSLPPMLVLQLMEHREDAADIFSLQAQAMQMDPRSYRHWWAFPVSTNAVSTSSNNVVSIALNSKSDNAISPVRIFGDYPFIDKMVESRTTAPPGSSKANSDPDPNFTTRTIPSLNKFSWVKGYVTIDRRDPRPYDTINSHFTVKNCSYASAQGTSTSNLSSSFGRKFGTYRMFLYVPPNATPPVNAVQKFDDSNVLFSRNEECLVSGGDPSTMLMNSKSINMPSSSGSSSYMLSCEFQPVKRRSIGGISVAFSRAQSTDEKLASSAPSHNSWSSPWSPTCFVLADKHWNKFVFVGRLPEDISKSSNTTAKIMVSPFSADRLFLHHKEALRDSVRVRNVELRYFPNYDAKLPAIDNNRLF